MTAKLVIDARGRLAGDADIAYNTPWPCPNGHYGMGEVRGLIMHTMVGNLPGTIQVFNNPSYGASAHFGISQAGHIHQFGPVGDWVAWHIAAGNPYWIGVEHADDGDPDNPLTEAQLTASAQIVEAVSAHYGTPLRVTDSTTGRGYGTHSMGGAAWGGHSCPDISGHHVRSSQRYEIIRRALRIRSGPEPEETDMTPAVVVAADGIHFFCVGIDGAVWTKQPGDSTWKSLGGSATSGVGATATGDIIVITMRGTNGQVWSKQRGADGKWGGWASQGGHVHA